MSKRNPILCVRRDFVERLLQDREGFVPAAEAHLPVDELLALEHAHFIPRPSLEQDESFLQIIPYCYMRDREAGDMLYYVRAEGGEKRLEGKTSVGFGGHVELTELAPGADVRATVEAAARREILEELDGVSVDSGLSATGVIMANDTPVDRVHLGLVYELPLAQMPAGFSDEILSVDRDRPSAILRRPNVETWTRLVLEALA